MFPVYPRWRGEHKSRICSGIGPSGLSPLARGTLRAYSPDESSTRFIPAGAGNTYPDSLNHCREAVYPRWRGEHHGSGKNMRTVIGLSPLARGTPGHYAHVRTRARFIPAGAGNTAVYGDDSTSTAVYPRWRGEHTKRISFFIKHFLSAPHSTNIIATI